MGLYRSKQGRNEDTISRNRDETSLDGNHGNRLGHGPWLRIAIRRIQRRHGKNHPFLVDKSVRSWNHGPGLPNYPRFIHSG